MFKTRVQLLKLIYKSSSPASFDEGKKRDLLKLKLRKRKPSAYGLFGTLCDKECVHPECAGCSCTHTLFYLPDKQLLD